MDVVVIYGCRFDLYIFNLTPCFLGVVIFLLFMNSAIAESDRHYCSKESFYLTTQFFSEEATENQDCFQFNQYVEGSVQLFDLRTSKTQAIKGSISLGLHDLYSVLQQYSEPSFLIELHKIYKFLPYCRPAQNIRIIVMPDQKGFSSNEMDDDDLEDLARSIFSGLIRLRSASFKEGFTDTSANKLYIGSDNAKIELLYSKEPSTAFSANGDFLIVGTDISINQLIYKMEIIEMEKGKREEVPMRFSCSY